MVSKVLGYKSAKRWDCGSHCFRCSSFSSIKAPCSNFECSTSEIAFPLPDKLHSIKDTSSRNLTWSPVISVIYVDIFLAIGGCKAAATMNSRNKGTLVSFLDNGQEIEIFFLGASTVPRRCRSFWSELGKLFRILGTC